ncbi:ion transporter [Gilvimarinus sp. SDUM040013]|uniref:Ion transporter n=1 Tax=Gilvimarinus gilvus TaxID=3058038 RepID=A0ABU4RUH1_9GAMM|nr:ion transporter [Gilvimarinus sp. SDUM040013]MDO3388252.1 ion transporter [Gilvimarinus sp. SDUM040013]MDX6847802.1 ion transporter [Gilvimarinus sp. SDUM040013]
MTESNQDDNAGEQLNLSDETLRQRLNRIIFGWESPAGKLFDVILIWAICISVLVLMLESVEWIANAYLPWLRGAEWVFTLFFTVEYAARLYCAERRMEYAKSFYGIVDLLSILPSYLAFFIPGANNLLIFRLLRVLRVFRILKLARYLTEANLLLRTMMLARRKILVFFSSVLVLSVIFGSLMYIVEGPENGFTSIPISIYWTIVTITTVGYGDIVPQTPIGQIISAMAMLTGYSIIAVPTGILTAELTQEMHRERYSRTCTGCERTGHEADAVHCRYCGSALHSQQKKSDT